MQRNYNANIVSTGEEEASEKVKIGNGLWASTDDSLEPLGLKPVRWKQSSESLAFHYPPYTSTITSKPGTSAIRGGKKDIYIDEAAFIPKFSDLWQAAIPAITRGDGRATVISTPFGESGLYFDMWKSGEWSMHDVPWWESRFMVRGAEFAERPYDVVAEARANAPEMSTIERINRFGSDKIKLIFEKGVLGDEIKFKTEYECQFVDEADSFIPWKLIKDNESPEKAWKTYHTAYQPEGYITIGVDLAKKRDSSVFTVVEHTNTQKKILFYYETQATYNEQFMELFSLVRQTNPHRISIDAGGPGAGFAERAYAGELNTRANVELVTFDNALKEQWATKFKGELQMGDKIILSQDQKSQAQIHSIKRTRLETGRYKFNGEPHDDYFWSTMLALYGIDRVPVTFSRIG
jgi:phage FluMu gp28-like protein